MTAPTPPTPPTPSTPSTARATAISWVDDARAAVPGWLVARVVVALAWFADQLLVEHRLGGVEPTSTYQGLFAWDGAYYQAIANHGYAGSGIDSLRFHPLLPILGHTGTGVLLVANLAAFVAAALVHRLVVTVHDDADLARRSATLVGLASPAFVLVFAYAEGLCIALAAAFLLLVGRRAWWAAATVGLLAGLARPTGLLLAVPALIEAVRWWRASDRSGTILGPLTAIAAPVVGVVSFLAWVEREFGDGWLPVRIQSTLRGGFVLPPLRLVEGFGEVVDDPLGDGLHVPFALLSVFLVWVCWRKRFPLSWTVLAAVAVLTNLAADNLNSTERYAYGTVPLLVALASVAGGRWWRPVLGISMIGLFGMATLAWYGDYVP